MIPVRLNAKELRFLEEQVEKSGLSREEYIRSIVMGGEVRARPCEHHTELLRKISVCATTPISLPMYQRLWDGRGREYPGNAPHDERDMELVKEEW